MQNKFTYPGIFSRLMSFTYDIFLVAALWFLFGFIFLGLYKLVFSENDYFPPPIGALDNIFNNSRLLRVLLVQWS